MTKKVQTTMTYDADCDTVFAMFRDEAYVTEKVAKTGGSNAEVTVADEGSDVLITAARDLPAEVPSFVKKFTGDTIKVVETTRWSPADDLGARSAAVKLEFAGTPSAVSGTLNLRPAGDGAVVDVDFDVKASVPLVGGKIEGVIAEQIERAIRQENKVGVAWLADH